MKLRMLFVTFLAAFSTATVSIPSQAADSAANAGLVRVKSRNFEQFYVRPNTDLAGFRKILIDPASVVFRKGWNKSKSVSQRISPAEVARIADEAAASVGSIFAESFEAQSYEIVATPGPGVLRLSLSLQDLYVNASDRTSAGVKSYTKAVGGATLHLDVYDATTGELLVRIVDHRKAEATQASMANSVSNRFWLETMFRRWAAACAREFAASKNRPLGTTTGFTGRGSTRVMG